MVVNDILQGVETRTHLPFHPDRFQRCLALIFPWDDQRNKKIEPVMMVVMTIAKTMSNLHRANYPQHQFDPIKAQQVAHLLFSLPDFNKTMVDIMSGITSVVERSQLGEYGLNKHGQTVTNPYLTMLMSSQCPILRAIDPLFDQSIPNRFDGFNFRRYLIDILIMAPPTSPSLLDESLSFVLEKVDAMKQVDINLPIQIPAFSEVLSRITSTSRSSNSLIRDTIRGWLRVNGIVVQPSDDHLCNLSLPPIFMLISFTNRADLATTALKHFLPKCKTSLNHELGIDIDNWKGDRVKKQPIKRSIMIKPISYLTPLQFATLTGYFAHLTKGNENYSTAGNAVVEILIEHYIQTLIDDNVDEVHRPFSTEI